MPQAAKIQTDRNLRTAEEARALVAHVESLFMPWNIDALVAGFTDDCVVRFGAILFIAADGEVVDTD